MAIEVMNLMLGTGELYWTPTGANPTPIYIGFLQELAVKMAGTSKKFKANKLFPADSALVGAELTGTAKFGQDKGDILAGIIGGVISTGMRVLMQAESTGVIAAATYTAANPTGFEDKGVCDETGVQLTRVASAPSTTQYSVTTGGVYTFNAGANGKTYTIRYTYTVSTGKQLLVSNQLAGAARQTYVVEAYNVYGAIKSGYRFPKAVITDWGAPMKSDDFVVQDVSMEFLPDANDEIMRKFWG